MDLASVASARGGSSSEAEALRFPSRSRGSLLPALPHEGYGAQDSEALPYELQFGRLLAEPGYIVDCPEAFPYHTVEEAELPDPNAPFAWWAPAAERLLSDNPDWTGIGRLVWDTSRVIDLLFDQSDLDVSRIVAMGHSFGGKMAFYCGSLDDRVQAIIASDFGIGWSFSNWDARWYHGPRIHERGWDHEHHQLLALHAPRPFFLLGGQYDRSESRQYLQSAQQVYRLYGRECAVGYLNHRSGHRPPPGAVAEAFRWLSEQFGPPNLVPRLA